MPGDPDTCARISDLLNGRCAWAGGDPLAPEPRPRPRSSAEVPAQTPESAALAKDLRGRGFRFLGPTTVYAFMQAAGLVDDHVAGCDAPRAGPSSA